jgi:hypothetical protein
MPNSKLSTATKAAQEVAAAIAKGAGNVVTPSTTPEASMIDGNVPAMIAITGDSVAGMMPKFKPEVYRVDDPLNPPETLPQVSESQFNQASAKYEGANRALKLTGMALDLTAQKFTTIGKFNKAVGAGFNAATEAEKTRGAHLDYLSQKETTSQKQFSLQTNQATTQTNSQLAVLDKQNLDEKLKQAQIKAEELRLKTTQAQSGLDAFKSQLGNYLEGSN